MMKKLLCSLSILGLLATSAQAQKVLPCGTDQVNNDLIKLYPEIATKNAALSEEIAGKLSKLTKKDLLPFAKTTADGFTIYDVPLVFHVIHDYGQEYVSDDSIKRCVEQTNEIFNKYNAGRFDVIAPFAGFINNTSTEYIGDGKIYWHLAKKDPMGNPTNGVTRRRSYLTGYGGDLAKYDQWPPNNYMNIWIINKMSDVHSNAAAYAYKPATGAVIPYYDGVITLFSYINQDNTIAHELGHELNLYHPWGSTNSPGVACGDDEVLDTPPTKGHDPAGGCSDLKDLYDTACLYRRDIPIAKQRIDSIKIISDTTIGLSRGIAFRNRTATTINELSFYPTAAIGSTYKIGLMRKDPGFPETLIDSAIVVTTVIDSIQKVTPNFVIPPADTNTTFFIVFMQNPGAARDTITASTSGYSRGYDYTILIKNVATDNFYNYFYNWRI
ncbi:MAG: hypothetical protein IT256_08995, partial [Chitinophagaceae bacterium]|nr:hypothetical protein [Chitinophagaceae bacterium]